MPKVETLPDGGATNQNDENHVSRKTGGLMRRKRDAEEIATEVPKRRRVVKKLIRIEPIYNNRNISITDDFEITDRVTERARRAYHRKRLLIKKKKRKITPVSTSHHRRRVVVTKKRLITSAQTIIPTITYENLDEGEESTGNTLSAEYEDIDDPTDPVEEPISPIEDYDSTTTFTDFDEERNASNSNQNLPLYEPFFPELSETIDDPVLLLKTTVLSSIDYETKTVVESRLRTYTFLITRVNGDDQEVTSTTEVKPHTKTVVITQPRTQYTTLTLLDLDSTKTLPFIPLSANPFVDSTSQGDQEAGRGFDEARHNLATRIMANGVEVIVAGDKSTLPGEPDVLRKLPSSIYKPVTLKPSTLSDHMMMVVPQDNSNIDFSSSLYPNQFVTKTCLTTFTYLTTYLESGSTVVSSHEKVISNIATEERNTGKILPTPSMGIILTQYPNLAVGVFVTTYTYLNTILDGEQPLVVTSKHTVSNTVTAPDDYLSLLLPLEKASAQRDTNTYYSTIALEKTIKDGDQTKVISTNEVVTQVVITESVPQKTTPIMTSYIALDVEGPPKDGSSDYITTDVVKTYYVTYTYLHTVKENDKTVVHTNISTSSDVVTEKIFLNKRTSLKTSSPSVINETPINKNKKNELKINLDDLRILAAKTYLTTFTYFTTLLQENDDETSTVISSHTRVVQDIVTDTINPNELDKKYLTELRKQIKEGSTLHSQLATLNNGQKVEITLVKRPDGEIRPTKVLPIEKTQMPESTTEFLPLAASEFSSPSVITGSTIIFFDDEDTDTKSKKATPTLTPKPSKSTKIPSKNNLNSLLSSEIVKKTKNTLSKPTTKSSKKQTISPTKSSTIPVATTNKIKDAIEKKPASKIGKPPTSQVGDLLGLGSININSLQALTPVLNAMAGLIQTNLKSPKRNESTTPKSNMKTEERNPPIPIPAIDAQNRSPIYIPVGSISDDLQGSESQNVPTVWNRHKNHINVGKPTHESPLLNGGIPISPGEVITANSDVIVGKIGRVGPRRPSIPFEKDTVNTANEEVPIGMKPPPVPNKMWPKRQPEATNFLKQPKPVIHVPNKDDYVGPPPPLEPPRNNYDSHKHIPLQEFPNTYAKDQNNYNVNFNVGQQLVFQDKIPNLQDEIQKTYELTKNNFPIYAQKHYPVQPSPIQEFNLQPSVLNEPLVFPEVIERSTGQPLLVNLQPSQVAFVNIPHNRTTALIYGGSTEPHRNGQYFDDPSPYQEPPYSEIENYKKPQFTVYNVQSTSQKQVGGVIKVGPHFVDHKIDSQMSEGMNVPLQIKPSKPVSKSDNEQNIKMQVPPISFGMIQQGNDITAHIINHSHRPESFTTSKRPYSTSTKTFSNNTSYTRQPLNYKQKPRPNKSELLDYMTPPKPPKNYVPLTTERTSTTPKIEVSTAIRGTKNSNRIPLTPINDLESINNLVNRPHLDNYVNYYTSIKSTYQNNDKIKPTEVNEPGEYVQESQKRPLRPGEVPIEILRAKITPKPIQNRTYIDNSMPYHRPILSNPRPFDNKPIVRPENKQTNQINHYEDGTIVQSAGPLKPTEKLIYISYRPDPMLNYPQTEKMNEIFGLKTSTPKTFVVYSTPKFTGDVNKNIKNFTRGQYSPMTINNKLEVTPLPVNNRYEQKHKIKTQTETGFTIRYKQTTLKTTTEVPMIISQATPELNTGEIPMTNLLNYNYTKADVDILKPPPMVIEQPPKEPSQDMQPPKIEINSPSGGIKKVPSVESPVFDLEAHANTPKPYIPELSEEMVPPPKRMIDEVVGLQPPTTHRPIVNIRPVLTKKPIFSLELDTVKEHKIHQSTTRPRRPTTQRPVYYRNNTNIEWTTNRPFYRKPTTFYTTESIINTTSKVVTKVVPEIISPSPTISAKPTMEVIIGYPQIEFKISSTEKISTSSNKEVPTSENPPIPTKEDIINVSLHHAGNEVKIIDDETSSPIITTPLSTIQETTKILPTKYITYTKTSTVTITETVVVETLGGTPSTLTILVTKTEKLTIVDTVTEFHTLVKPTNIVETIISTIKQEMSSLYSPDASYGNVSPSFPIQPTVALKQEESATKVVESDEEDLEEFIIHETDPPLVEDSKEDSNESIFVVMTDENHGTVIHVPKEKPNEVKYETGKRDEMVHHNEASNVLLGGVLIASPPSLETPDIIPTDFTTKCTPECQASKNELCQKMEGIMRCVCRPGFARMFPDRPCKPTYTYNVKVGLERYGQQNLLFEEELKSPTNPKFARMAATTHEALDRMVMQSDLRDIYHGVHVSSFEPLKDKTGVMNNFYLQLSDNTDEKRLEDVFKKYLRSNNFSLGGTELFASKESLDDLKAEDFDECSNPQFHDCSEHALCFNLKGTYTCSCKEGFSDLSENILYPGRLCSAELIGCEKCHYHGTCYSRGDDQICECFQWYAGENCHVNLKVLLIALVTLGTILFVLLLVCIIMTCARKRHTNAGTANGMSFLPQRVAIHTRGRGTLDRRAMIQDTSSESSQSEVSAPPYVAKKQKKLKGALKKPSKSNMDVENGGTTISFPDQKDRSLTVMIPRAKYHPAPPTSPLLSMSTFDKRKMSAASSNEAKLLSYLDAGPTPSKSDATRKFSNAHSDSFLNSKSNLRKTSGALVSAGFEVSATVSAINMGTLDTTCGTEADRSENATLIQKISADLLSSTGTRSQFNTLRQNLENEDDDAMNNWLDLNHRIATISEARSCDETTIPPVTKSFRNDYTESKHSSQHLNDEANTMAERDLGSTFLLPHMHLYKPERGSDASGFESI